MTTLYPSIHAKSVALPNKTTQLSHAIRVLKLGIFSTLLLYRNDCLINNEPVAELSCI